jgi:hypothetical protein
VALRPQQPVPQFFEPPVQPDPLRGLWTDAVAAVALVLGVLEGALKQIAARWRGIVLAHIFFLTLWLAIQVFFFATGAYWCLPAENSKFVGWFSKLLPQISRCGPAVSVLGSLPSADAVAVSSLGLPKASSLGSASASPARSGAAASSASPAFSSAVPPAAPFAGPPAVSSAAPPAAPFAGSGANWSSKSVANCWRDRSAGNCYGRTEAHRKLPPARFRYPSYPCRRPSDCGWDAI